MKITWSQPPKLAKQAQQEQEVGQGELDDKYKLYRDFLEGQGETKPVYVSLYEVAQAYGGPEEGGWWYNVSELLETRKFFDRDEAEKFAEALNNGIEGSGRNDEDLSSSRGFDQYPDPSGGDPMYDHSDSDIPLGFSGLASHQHAIVEDRPGENETQGRPQYE